MRGTRLIVAAVAVSATAAGLVVPPATAEAAPLTAQPRPSEVVGLVVTRDPGTSARQAQALVAEAVGPVEGRRPVAPGVTAISVPDLSAAQAVRAARSLEDEAGIARVDLDTRVHPDAVPDDPLFGQQWALSDPVSGVAAPSAWDLATGAGQVIAVIDSGITGHPDLVANLLPGYDMIEDPVSAHDGDGRDADPADEGDWLTVSEIQSNPGTFAGCSIQTTSSWHGTHVAGIAAATGNNGTGVIGVAPSAKILPVRALGKCGGTMSDVAAAITWASGGEVPGVPTNPTPADVINLSLSSATSCQPFVQAAIDGAMSRGTTVVASAGNNAAPFVNYSPGGCYDILTVGALTRTGSRATYSNYGVVDRDLPLFAPGGTATNATAGILSTINLGQTTATTGGYAAYYGTSMAAPQVAGAAAVLQERAPMAPSAVAEHLRDTARTFPAGSNCTGSCGAGMLDVRRALTISPRVPGPIGELVAAPADSALSVSWSAPTDPGTGPVVAYAVEYRPDGGDWIVVPDLWSSTLTRKVLSELTNGVGHQVRVAARNVFGQGPWTQSGVVTPRGLPGGVQILSVRYPTKTSVRLRVGLPPEQLTGLQYRLTRTGRTPGDWTDAALSPSMRINGLAKGVRHTLEVRAFNERGAGASASRQVATPVKPGKVRALKVRRSGPRARIVWKPPVRTGLKVRYRVRIGQGLWFTTSRTKSSVRKLPAGPVRVSVRARNEAGLGPVRVLMKRK